MFTMIKICNQLSNDKIKTVLESIDTNMYQTATKQIHNSCVFQNEK